jgi:hypothetical protein
MHNIDKIDNVKIVLEEENQASGGEHDQNVRRSTRTITRLVRLTNFERFPDQAVDKEGAHDRRSYDG